MIYKICALGLVASGLFLTGCTINRYKVVHNDHYLVIINSPDKETESEDDSDGQVTALPVGKQVAPVPQRLPDPKKSF
jgi:hypothetical protein